MKEVSAREDLAAEAFHCDVARGRDIDRAIELRRRVYVEEFGFDLGKSARDALDSRAFHLLATTDTGDAAGSLRLIDAPSRPFEVERFLDIDRYLYAESHPAEITRVCVLARFRKLSHVSGLHVAMLRAVFRLARQLGVTQLIGSAREDIVPIYRYLLFDVYPEATYSHPEIGGERHVLMGLNLSMVGERYRLLRKTLYEYLQSELAGI